MAIGKAPSAITPVASTDIKSLSNVLSGFSLRRCQTLLILENLSPIEGFSVTEEGVSCDKPAGSELEALAMVRSLKLSVIPPVASADMEILDFCLTGYKRESFAKKIGLTKIDKISVFQDVDGRNNNQSWHHRIRVCPNAADKSQILEKYPAKDH